MKKIIYYCMVALCFTACNQEEKFTISGVIHGAEGQTLYLEHVALMGTQTLDSLKLKTPSKFSFRAPKPTYPELYRLRLGTQTFIFPIDSCEHISIETNADSLLFPSKIEGSENALQIQQLRQSVATLQTTYKRLKKEEETIDVFQQQVNAHKQLAQNIIFKNPRSIVAYYALFQKIGEFFIFSPYNKSDRTYYAAVATSFNTYMPQYERSNNLYNLVIDAINDERKAQNTAYLQELIQQAEMGLIDITLPNPHNEELSLSSLRGKVVLLDFSLFETDQNIAYTFELRELYNRYSARGFEIYQVSVDRNKLLWENACKELPWLCVYAKEGLNATCLRSYNVRQLPTTFLIDKTNTVVGRNIPFDKLPAEIEKYLQ